jgi:hypothetical protein
VVVGASSWTLRPDVSTVLRRSERAAGAPLSRGALSAGAEFLSAAGFGLATCETPTDVVPITRRSTDDEAGDMARWLDGAHGSSPSALLREP